MSMQASRIQFPSTLPLVNQHSTELEEDSLDMVVEKIADKHKKSDFIIPYWYNHKDEMLQIFEEIYPLSRTAKWVNYELFKLDIIGKMANELFNTILEEYPNNFDKEGDEITVSFCGILGIIMCCTDVEEDDRIQDNLYDLGISITVTYIKGG